MKTLQYFNPIKNHIDKNAGYDGYLFETFGKELEFVREHYNKNIFTLLDDGETILSGYHVVNRFGYFITEVENDDMDLQIEYA